MASGINEETLFSGTFSDTSQLTSNSIIPSETHGVVTIFVAPTGPTVTVVVQCQDPAGTWHTITGSNATLTGTCDAIPIPFNAPMRVLLTPSAGSGSALIWARSYGS